MAISMLKWTAPQVHDGCLIASIAHAMEPSNAFGAWRDYYDMSSDEVELMVTLFQKKSANPSQPIILTLREISLLGDDEEGLTKVAHPLVNWIYSGKFDSICGVSSGITNFKYCNKRESTSFWGSALFQCLHLVYWSVYYAGHVYRDPNLPSTLNR